MKNLITAAITAGAIVMGVMLFAGGEGAEPTPATDWCGMVDKGLDVGDIHQHAWYATFGQRLSDAEVDLWEDRKIAECEAQS